MLTRTGSGTAVGLGEAAAKGAGSTDIVRRMLSIAAADGYPSPLQTTGFR